MIELAAPPKRAELITTLATDFFWRGKLAGYTVEMSRVRGPKLIGKRMYKDRGYYKITWRICIRRKWYEGESTDVFHSMADMESLIRSVKEDG